MPAGDEVLMGAPTQLRNGKPTICGRGAVMEAAEAVSVSGFAGSDSDAL